MPEKISHEIMSAAYAIAPSCHGFDTALSLAITAVAAYEKEKAKPPAVEETVTATDDLEPLRKRLDCPKCGDPHVDVGNWLYRKHHTHTCHRCHHEWRLEEYVFGSNSGLFMGHRIFAEGFNSGCE